MGTPPNHPTQLPVVQAQPRQIKREFLKITSLNIRGRVSTIGGFRQEKWFKIYNLLNLHRIALLAIQESHLTDKLARDVNSAFNSKLKVFYSSLPNNNNAVGVVIVVNRHWG